MDPQEPDKHFGGLAPALTYEQVAHVFAYREHQLPKSREWVRQIETLAKAKMRVKLAGWSHDPDEKRKAEDALAVLIRTIKCKEKRGGRKKSNADTAVKLGNDNAANDP